MTPDFDKVIKKRKRISQKCRYFRGFFGSPIFRLFAIKGLDDANCKISVFFSNDVIANAFEEIYFLSSYNHWEIYCVSLQVHLEKYISCHPMHLWRKGDDWDGQIIGFLAQMHFVTNT